MCYDCHCDKYPLKTKWHNQVEMPLYPCAELMHVALSKIWKAHTWLNTKYTINSNEKYDGLIYIIIINQ